MSTPHPAPEGHGLEGQAIDIVSAVHPDGRLQAHRILAGAMTFKYQVDADGGDAFIVRFYPASRSGVADYEPDLLRRCRAQGILTPEVVLDDRSGPSAPLRYMVYRRIPGQALDSRMDSIDPQTLGAVCRAVGTELQKLSGLAIDGWGDLVDSTTGAFGSWEAFIEESMTQGLQVAREGGLLSTSQLADLETIRSSLDLIRPPHRPALAWGDVSPEHIILDEHDRVLGLIDFEGALSADVMLNYGYLYARYGNSDFVTRLLQSLPEAESADVRRRLYFYAVLRALRILRNGRRPLPTGERRSPIGGYLVGFESAVQAMLQLC